MASEETFRQEWGWHVYGPGRKPAWLKWNKQKGAARGVPRGESHGYKPSAVGGRRKVVLCTTEWLDLSQILN